MADFSQWWWQAAGEDPGPGPGPGPDPGDPIGQSLRFRGDCKLERLIADFPTDFSATGTFSAWYKLSDAKEQLTLFLAPNIGAQDRAIQYTATEQLKINATTTLTPRYRDPSAWYNVILQSDGTEIKVWVNGDLVESGLPPWQAGTSSYSGDAWKTTLPTAANGLYEAQVFFIDGQALEPTAFGRFNTVGVWVPVDYSGSFGSNGFHLDFADPSNIGKDISGNDNDFTATGLETVDTSSPDFDRVLDSPTQNWATINSLGPGNSASDANLTYSPDNELLTTIGMPQNSGRFYMEVGPLVSGTGSARGVALQTHDYNNSVSSSGVGNWSVYTSNPTNLLICQGDTGVTTEVQYFLPNSGIWQIAYDSDTGEAWLGIDGQFYDSDFNETIVGTNPTWANVNAEVFAKARIGSYDGGQPWPVNFGQKPLLHQPNGWRGIQTQNLPAAPIADGRDHFQAITGPGQGGYQMYINQTRDETLGINSFTEIGLIPGNTAVAEQFILDCFGDITTTSFTIAAGWGWASNAKISVSVDGSANSWTVTNENQTMSAGTTVTVAYATEFRYIKLFSLDGGGTNFGEIVTDNNPLIFIAQSTFPNGLWWIKDRVNSNQHQLVDSVTNAAFGGNKANTMPANSQAIDYVPPAGDSVAWCWSSAEPDVSGFNIIHYTGQNPTTVAVPHGLGKKPDLIFTFSKAGTTRNPAVYHSSTGADKYFILANPDSAISAGPLWANTEPDETNFYVGAANTTNYPGATFGAYVWTAIPGYSAFGSYQGNGDPDGPVIWTGFRVSFLMVKRSSGTGNWWILDSTRNQSNPAINGLYPNLTQYEDSGFNDDLLSNGFKLRETGSSLNSSGDMYVYAAFAENPFQAPATAR